MTLRTSSLVRLAATLSLAVVTLAPAVASASFPAGVWGLLDKVTPSGDVNNPMIRIDGVFIVGNQAPDFPDYPGYSVPKYGYMYYACPKGQEKVCAMEWAELTAAAGTEDNCRGWGDLALKDNGSVRESDPMMNPDLYPIAGGVYTGFSPCEALKMWVQANPDTTTGGDVTTGDATTGDATTGDATTGDATTGDATTGDATTGDATTGDTRGTGTGDTMGTGGTGDTAGTGTGDTAGTGTGDTQGTGGTGDTAGTGTGDTMGTGGTGDTGGTGEAGSGSGEAGTGDSASGGGDEDKEGCACRSDEDTAPAGLFSLLLGLGLIAGRRRRA